MRDTKRKRFKKRIIVIPAIALIIVGALVFGIVRRNKADSVVKVVNVGEVNSVWFLEEGGQYYGTLKKGSVVNYKAEEELEIEDILVKKGDSVSKGDVLFTYNTKSLEFNANTCENELKAIENKITIANNELTILKRLQPSENAPSDYEPEEEPGDETNDVPESYVPTLKLEERITKDTKPYSGSGTSDDPFVYLASDKTVVTKDALISLADGGRYALIYVCMPSGDVMYGRNIDGSRIDKSSVSDWVCSFGISMDAMGGVSVSQETPFVGLVVYPYRVNVLEAGSPEELPEMDGDDFEIPEDYEETTPDNQSDPKSLSTYEISDKDNYMYPRAELNNMIAEEQKEIEKLGLDKKQAEINLKKAQAKLETGAELASISGTVTFIAPDVKHLSDSGYFATITSSGGMSVSASVGEFSRDKIAVGDTVTMTDWNTGSVYSGEVISISDTPIESSESGENYDGLDQSMYEFVVASSDDFEIGEDEGVSIMFDKDSSDGLIGLMGAYVREENGRFYVLVENSDGILEKRTVKTKGGIKYGYVAISGGITKDDYIAIAYGTSKVGLHTEHVTVDQLEGGMLGGIL